eukprot:760091-Heterocapsa_arctica.AAC.1
MPASDLLVCGPFGPPASLAGRSVAAEGSGSIGSSLCEPAHAATVYHSQTHALFRKRQIGCAVFEDAAMAQY